MSNDDDDLDKARQVANDMINTLEEADQALENAETIEEARQICGEIESDARNLQNELPDTA